MFLKNSRYSSRQRELFSPAFSSRLNALLKPMLTVGILLAGPYWGLAHAEGEEDAALEEEAKAGQGASIYLPMKPFTVNFGGKGSLRYFKTEISIRLDNNNAANSVRHHVPLIRNNLVLLFSAQTAESLLSQEGRETLRQQAREEVAAVIKREDGTEGVVDIYFNTFLVQK